MTINLVNIIASFKRAFGRELVLEALASSHPRSHVYLSEQLIQTLLLLFRSLALKVLTRIPSWLYNIFGMDTTDFKKIFSFETASATANCA